MSPRPSSRLFTVGAAALLLAACNARDVESKRSEQTAACTRCHGGVDNETGAPPRGVSGEASTTDVVVGAHTAHVEGPGHLAPALGCETCHEAPDPGNPGAHVDGRTVPRFGPLASAGGVTPAWDRATATCTVYCHGATLAGGDDRTPTWTRVDGTQGDCGSCHGVPPPAPHPMRFDCARCHPESLDMGGPPGTATLRHLNGVVDLAGGCATCHGNPDRVTSVELVKGAPPSGVDGETATTARAVGAHEAHLLGGELAAPIACETCHDVPTEQTHSDGVVDLRFAGVATAQGVTASLGVADPANPTCTTYCHGATLDGGSVPQPTWTRVDGTQAACGACHGAPPERVRNGAAAHPAGDRCGICHPGTVDRETGAIRVANGMHVNGTVDVADFHPEGWAARTSHGYAANDDLAGCKSCHGDDFGGGGTGISCNACHTAAGQAGWATDCTFCHGDANRAQDKAAPPVGTHGELAATDRAVGAHAKHLAGGSLRTAMACTECHAVPTTVAHVTGTVDLTWGPLATSGGAAPAFAPDATCSSTYCHGATLAIGGGSETTPLWTGGPSQATCGTCHGVPPPAPHPQTGSCAACHPDTITAGGAIDLAGGRHVNGAVEVLRHPDGFAAPDQHGLAANRDLASCRACHGDDLAGGVTGVSCATCHGATWQSNCTFCHGTKVASYTPADLVRAAPPQGTQNETATTVRGVGAHARHLTGGDVSNAFACSECHAVPADLAHVNGARALAFGARANADGVTSSFTGTTCTTYCHGATLAGGARPAPVWTTVDGTQGACGSCHGLPPATIGGTRPHSPNPNCGGCHEGFTASSVNKALHVNGAVDVRPFTCASCHGDASRPGSDTQKAAPPVDSAGQTASAAVGAHQRHLQGGALSLPIACTACHVVPTAMDHSDVVVQTVPAAGWNDAAGTCTNACHGAFAPVWARVDGTQAACGTCHGIPPDRLRSGAAHPQNPNCAGCHGAGYSSSAVNVATHVDGVIDVVPFTCASCHGDASRAGTELVKAAPPSGSAGETAESALAVGAHAAHVFAPTLTDGFACTECHVVPPGTDVGPPALHADGTVAMSFAGLSNQGTTTAWDRAAGTCSASYCHGSFDGGQLLNAPVWTAGGSQAVCGSCHGAPPPSPHVRNPNCGGCHGAGYSATTVAAATHVDGTVQVGTLTCSSCHGDATRAGDEVRKAAPPLGSGGESLTSERAVGAHERHLTAGVLSGPVACAQCHAVPPTGDTTHANGTAAVQYGATWSRDGVTPAWNTAGLTCTTYCHGATLAGGAVAAPSWTGGASQATCGACHGLPPATIGGTRPHSQNPNCGGCHGAGYTGGSVDLALHLNGTVDVGAMSCSSCHGDGTRAGDETLKAAPPVSVAGATATTARGVGAHLKHLTGATIAATVACAQCHPVPPSGDDTHANGTTAVTFGSDWSRGNATPAWNATDATCTSYCHGTYSGTYVYFVWNGETFDEHSFAYSRAGGTPTWTGGAMTCTSCHGAPPDATGAWWHSGRHGSTATHNQCSTCHPGVTRDGTGFVDRSRHVNGVVDVQRSGTGCSNCH